MTKNTLDVKTFILPEIPPSEELKTWKDVRSSDMKKLSFKDKKLESMEGFSIETSNIRIS